MATLELTKYRPRTPAPAAPVFNVPVELLTWPCGNTPRVFDDTDTLAKLTEPLGYEMPNVPEWALKPILGDEGKPYWLQRVPTGTPNVCVLRFELHIRRSRPHLKRFDLEGGRIGGTECACAYGVDGQRGVTAFVTDLPEREPNPGEPMSLGYGYVVFESGKAADGGFTLFSKPETDNEFSRRFNLS